MPPSQQLSANNDTRPRPKTQPVEEAPPPASQHGGCAPDGGTTMQTHSSEPASPERLARAPPSPQGAPPPRAKHTEVLAVLEHNKRRLTAGHAAPALRALHSAVATRKPGGEGATPPPLPVRAATADDQLRAPDLAPAARAVVGRGGGAPASGLSTIEVEHDAVLWEEPASAGYITAEEAEEAEPSAAMERWLRDLGCAEKCVHRMWAKGLGSVAELSARATEPLLKDIGMGIKLREKVVKALAAVAVERGEPQAGGPPRIVLAPLAPLSPPPRPAGVAAASPHAMRVAACEQELEVALLAEAEAIGALGPAARRCVRARRGDAGLWLRLGCSGAVRWREAAGQWMRGWLAVDGPSVRVLSNQPGTVHGGAAPDTLATAVLDGCAVRVFARDAAKVIFMGLAQIAGLGSAF